MSDWGSMIPSLRNQFYYASKSLLKKKSDIDKTKEEIVKWNHFGRNQSKSQWYLVKCCEKNEGA